VTGAIWPLQNLLAEAQKDRDYYEQLVLKLGAQLVEVRGRMVDVLMERDRYRKALQEIVEGDIDAYLVACEALGIHKK
jgi:hypothetical protein